MKLVLGVYDYPPHPYHYKFIDDTWVFSDIQPRHPMIKKVDARKIPYKDVEAIYASHILEHIHYAEVEDTLKHWFEVLKKGGYVHINVPDIEWALDCLMMKNANEPSESEYFNTRERLMQIFNGTMEDKYDVHMSWYTQEKLQELLEYVGFKDVEVKKVYEAHEMQCLIAKGFKHGN